jgi:O-antigen/teichoic acid export membrane protein
MSKSSALAKNTLLIGVSRVSTQLVTFFMLPLYTSALSTRDYGAVDLIVTYGGLFAPLIMLNVQQSVFRYLVDARTEREAQHKIITNAVEITLLTSLLVAVAYMVAGRLIKIPFASSMAFYFASFIIGDLVLQITRGLGKIKAYAIAGIAQGLLTFVLNFVFVLILKMGVNGMLVGMGFGMLIPAIVLIVYSGTHRSVKFSSRDRVTKKNLLAFSLPLLPNTISWWVYNVSDRTIISVVLGVAANGIYAVSNKFSNIANSLSSIFFTSWSESAILAINEPDRDEFFSRIANVTLRTFSSLGIFIMISTRLIFPFLVNAKFKEALLYVPLLILGTIFSTVVSFYSAIYIAKKLTKQVANTSIAAAIINLVINIALIRTIGIWAAAISTTAAYAVMAVYRHHDIKKHITITYENNLFAKLIILYVVATALYYTNTTWSVITAFVMSSLAVYWLSRYELKRISNMVIRLIRK